MAAGSETVRVGVIGVGIGQSHLRGYAKVENARVVALCDVNEARAREVAQNCNVPDAEVFADYRALLERSDIDAVSVCLPNNLHCPVSVAALEAGKHVLCEKPLALNAQDAQSIADAANRSGKKCMVAQLKRFSAQAQWLKSAISAGELGSTYYAHAYWTRRRGIPHYGGWFTDKELSGGGPLIDIGVHLLDAAWWLAGCPKPVAAMGATYAEFGPRGQGLGSQKWRSERSKPEGKFDVEDLAVGLLRFENGLTINLEISWALHTSREQQGVELFGTDGGVCWEDGITLARDIHGVASNTQIELPQQDAWAVEMRHFITSIVEDRIPDPDATQGVTMMKMLDALYLSAQSGREVCID